MSKATLLVEIGVEELPPKAMRQLGDAFAHGLGGALDEAGLAHGKVDRYVTPRRLAVAIHDTVDTTEPTTVHKAGPTLAIAFDDQGKPTAAAEGFARSLNTTVDALEREHSRKGERLVYRDAAPGKALADLLQAAIDDTLRRLPIPKRMRWGTSQAAFVRPVHWCIAMHGSDLLALDVLGEHSGCTSYGHRFHHPGPIELTHADDYETRLHHPGHVIADPDRRKRSVHEQVEVAARQLDGQALMTEDLIEEVTALVEWPIGIAGRFEAHFLTLPREVLISTLQDHQRYFPVESQGRLIAGFVTIANLESRDVSQVIAGNERVIRPRLADALFFWEQDRRHGLAAHVDDLARVSFQKELGSLANKSARVMRIAGYINEAVGADAETVERAAILAKTDLLTEMVGEFPELQGIMGRYYALDAGEPTAVADALAEQYAPAGAGAAIARTPTGRIIALADRLDTLAGIFAIDRRPTGDKDPFALRRAALGVLRTLIEGGISLDLTGIIEHAIAQQPVNPPAETFDALWMFHMERLRGYYADQGIATDRFDAIASLKLRDMHDFDTRIRALDAFMNWPAAAIVCNAHKRIRNILRRNNGEINGAVFDAAYLVDNAERALAHTLSSQYDTVEHSVTTHRYERALASLTEFAEPLDRFFDEVMVMIDDDDLRRNRLALLGQIDGLCRLVADISHLSPD